MLSHLFNRVNSFPITFCRACRGRCSFSTPVPDFAFAKTFYEFRLSRRRMSFKVRGEHMADKKTPDDDDRVVKPITDLEIIGNRKPAPRPAQGYRRECDCRGLQGSRSRKPATFPALTTLPGPRSSPWAWHGKQPSVSAAKEMRAATEGKALEKHELTGKFAAPLTARSFFLSTRTAVLFQLRAKPISPKVCPSGRFYS